MIALQRMYQPQHRRLTRPRCRSIIRLRLIVRRRWFMRHRARSFIIRFIGHGWCFKVNGVDGGGQIGMIIHGSAGAIGTGSDIFPRIVIGIE